ncbi:MAG: FGGY-family carbohydrate kinase [Kaiparowitsia implicata GSE-PSE-MK54-09C]|jgi:sugar (pentulose or hexulose) kinase|nr:FGGY-family carbohydrate kinase [Kaiparowitsia implicata GSE-PSE-MK54-09C]
MEPSKKVENSDYALGIDFGTSGARAIALDQVATLQAQASISLAEQTTDSWQHALFELLSQIPIEVRTRLGAIALNGTSSTIVICDSQGLPLSEPMLYNDDRGASILEIVRQLAPPDHTVISATSSLAKLIWWLNEQAKINQSDHSSIHSLLDSSNHSQNPQSKHSLSTPSSYLLHQADWLAFLLHGRVGISDYHNALKLGYDVGALRYPDWITPIAARVQLPQVMEPGQAIAPIRSDLAEQFQISTQCQICAGTTDSIAAFLASGAAQPGDAVTSLGSTLVLKLLSTTRVDDSRYGIYSHRLGDLWLVGGASNTGGAVLRHFFTAAELEAYSRHIDPTQDSPLHYYPLLKPGERFPIQDPTLEPCLDPRPEDAVEFLHGLLQSIARIEAQGYRLLQELGATPLQQVWSAGGGANNAMWMQMRSRLLGHPVLRSPQTEAAYGTAQMALRAIAPV